MKCLLLFSACVLPLSFLFAEPIPEPVNLPLDFQEAMQHIQKENNGDFSRAVRVVLDAAEGEEQFESLMKQAADEGHPAALYFLASGRLKQLLAQRIHDDTLLEEIRVQMHRAAEGGYHPAMLELARMLGNGLGGAVEEEKAMEWLMRACREGSPQARAIYLQFHGKLEKTDAPEMESELKKNNFYLEEVLALFHQSRTEESELWLRKAAEHGSATAPFLLSQQYYPGISPEEALQFLHLAAERHMPEALMQCALLEWPGNPLPPMLEGKVKQDTNRAIRYLQEASLLGYAPATTLLAGYSIRRTSPERVFRLYRRATEQGDARGTSAYAYCLVKGRGCKTNAEEGWRILRQLGDEGVAAAHMAMADLFFNGHGTAPDMLQAINALGEAAAAGEPYAYSTMAALTALGNAEMPPDADRATIFLQMAEEQGEPNSSEVYRKILSAGEWHFLPPVRE